MIVAGEPDRPRIADALWFRPLRAGQSDGAQPPMKRGSRDNRHYRDRLGGDSRGGRAYRAPDHTAPPVRVAGLDLKELSPEQRAAYEARWEAAQEQFIDNPRQATQTAAGLVTAVAAEIGYPVDDREQLLADLSVNHGKYLDGYRGAIRATDQAADGSTEEFRQALLDYRTLFNDLIGAPAADGARTRTSRRDQAAVEQSS
jgi:hypothetical protein